MATNRDSKMETTCEVVGWLLEDDAARVLVRDEHGGLSLHAVNPQSTFEHQAIQTGSFRRGNPIVDPVTQETIGYEMECLPNPLAPLN
jgi:hypothetical protein